MRKKELTKEQKAVIEDIKIIWKNNFPNVKIYSDKRKTFYRVKLYMVPVRIARKAKKLAEKFPNLKFEHGYLEEGEGFWVKETYKDGWLFKKTENKRTVLKFLRE